MIFTVEPMINLGRPHVKLLSDGWTAVTRDRSLSAQFEHTVGITETGVEIFTLSPSGRSWLPWKRRLSVGAGRAPNGRIPGCRRSPLPRPPRQAARPLPRSGRLRLADYELLEMAIFRAIQRGDTKPLAKALLRGISAVLASVRKS